MTEYKDYTEKEQRLNDSQRETLDNFAAVLSESESNSGYNMVSSWVSVEHGEERSTRFAISLVVTSNKNTIRAIWDFVETLARAGQFGESQKLFKEQLSDLLTTEEHHGID